MKVFYLLLLTSIQTPLLFGQNEYWKLPYKYNSFINKADISWACEMQNIHSFDLQPDSFNIHEYIKKAQKNGTIRSYLTTDMFPYDAKKWAKAVPTDYYFEVDKGYIKECCEDLHDSLKSIEFHEIFYVEDHKLKSKITSAGPQYKIFTSLGIYLGNTIASYSSLSYYPEPKPDKKDIIRFLGTTYTTFNFDSIESSTSLKKTYGMTLSLLLWYDLSKGFNNVMDMKSNKVIPPKLVMDFSPFDSTDVSCGDTTAMCKVPGAPGFIYFSDIGIYQNWYYNKTKDIFFNKITKTNLYIKYQDQKSFIYRNEKRFEINFK